MNYTTLISAADLAAHLDDPDIVICDCRHDLTDLEAGRRAYAKAHIPGARFVHLDEDLSATRTGTNGRHPLPQPDAVGRHLGNMGINARKQVVAYDATGGCYAARLWWMLRWLGHRRVALLDGGWQAWINARLPVTHAVPVIVPTEFASHVHPEFLVDANFIVGRLQTPEMCIIDARSHDRFNGENETLDPVAGHIPGAVNRFFRHNLDGTGRFKNAVQLRREFDELLGTRAATTVVHQCGSGVTACHNLLAMEIAGLSGSRLYPGSWSEWVSDSARPIVGSAPAA